MSRKVVLTITRPRRPWWTAFIIPVGTTEERFDLPPEWTFQQINEHRERIRECFQGTAAKIEIDWGSQQ